GGTTMVFVRASTIGGDNYRIKAELDLASMSQEVQDAHRGLTFAGETGELEIWRRVTIGAYLTWGTVTAVSGAQWDAVREHFRHAFIDVVGPLRDMTVVALPAAPKKLLEDKVTDCYAGRTQAGGKRTAHYDPASAFLKFSPDYWFAEDPRTIEFAGI